jgi:Cu(I)/Ag(I) efflux system protein CusF
MRSPVRLRIDPLRLPMKHGFLGIILAVLAGTSVAHDADAPPSAFPANQGIVRSVDKPAREIVIRHGPLSEVDMPPMTMAFEVADARLLDKVRAGDRVKFRVALLNGRFTVIAIQRLR